jgi:alpha-tubulin suppressor-like RCC1 family protein
MPRLTFAVPRRIIPPPVESVNFIHAGVNFSYGLTSFGFAQNFGINNVGQLGNNSTNFTNTPVSLGGLVKTFCKIAGTGGFDNVNNTGWAIDKNGLVWGWGDNSFGQIGDNTVTQRLTPISIRGNRKTFCEIAVGESLGLGSKLSRGNR